ncbi:MAG: thioesterase family protein [Clostridiales bacterium]|nr:thioesterase family protein [Clostridiales bacterium]
MLGKKYSIEKTVTPDMTAKAIGSGGLDVFGTPFMLAMMENAAMTCIASDLPEGSGTVGIHLDVSHVAPTPVGMKVTAEAEVTHVSANGKVVDFRVTAYDEVGLIGEGDHQRAIVSNDRFFKKCQDKQSK